MTIRGMRGLLIVAPLASSASAAEYPNDSSSKFSQRVAGVERSEPPDPRLSGGSLALDPGHPRSKRPNLELLNELEGFNPVRPLSQERDELDLPSEG